MVFEPVFINFLKLLKVTPFYDSATHGITDSDGFLSETRKSIGSFRVNIIYPKTSSRPTISIFPEATEDVGFAFAVTCEN